MRYPTKAHQSHAPAMVGRRFGRLTVVAVAESITTHSRVECVCDCGTDKPVVVELRKLKEGHTKSCGCMRRGVTITPEHLRRGAEMMQRRLAERNALRDILPPTPLPKQRHSRADADSLRAPGWGPSGREAARDLADALGYTYRIPSGGQRKVTTRHRLLDDADDAVETMA